MIDIFLTAFTTTCGVVGGLIFVMIAFGLIDRVFTRAVRGPFKSLAKRVRG